MGHLAGRVALVTGSSRGIGRAVAHSLAKHGASVVVNGRDPGALDDAVRGFSSDAAVVGVPGSAADPDVLDTMMEEGRRLGVPDILVACAGTAEPPGSSILNLDPTDWHNLIDAHLTSAFVACRAIAPTMVQQGRGSIVLTASHAYTGVFGGTGYPAGKGGVVSLTYALAQELAEHGVRVNAVCPGAATRLSKGDEYVEHIEELHRRGLLDDLMRIGALNPAPAEYVAEIYAALASDLTAHVTGQVLSGSGGYLGCFAKPRESTVGYRDHAATPPYRLAEIADLLR